MDKNRRGESGFPPFRSGRFFNVGCEWFFATREGRDEGPYPSKTMAEAALLNFVRDRGFVHTRGRGRVGYRYETDSTDALADKSADPTFYW